MEMPYVRRGNRRRDFSSSRRLDRNRPGNIQLDPVRAIAVFRVPAPRLLPLGGCCVAPFLSYLQRCRVLGFRKLTNLRIDLRTETLYVVVVDSRHPALACVAALSQTARHASSSDTGQASPAGALEMIVDMMEASRKRPESSPQGRTPVGGERRRGDGKIRQWRGAIGQRRELVAQHAETVALLAQNTTIDSSVELDDLAQRPEGAEQCRVVRLGRSLGGCHSRLGTERRGVDQRIARAAGASSWPEPWALPVGGPALPRRSDRLPAGSVDGLRHRSVRRCWRASFRPAGADFDDHATVGGVRGRADLSDSEIALVLAFGVLVEFGVLHDELADGGRQAADVEVAVPAVDGLDG